MSKNVGYKIRIGFLVSTLFLLLLFLPLSGRSVQAASQDRTISLHYDVSDVTLSLYKVADLESDGSYQLTGSFASVPVDVSGLTSEKLSSLAQTLAGYVSVDGIAADQTGTVASDNTLTFQVDSNGIYLILGETVTKGNTTYMPQPAITTMPCSTESGDISYAPVMEIKYTSSTKPDTPPTTPETISVSAYKIWDDDNNIDGVRPDSITVDLLQNGTVIRESTLNASNNWAVSWSGLSKGYTYTVVEVSVPSGYTVSQSQSGDIHVITNTHTPKTPPETPNTPPGTPSTPGNNNSTPPDNFFFDDSGDNESTPFEDDSGDNVTDDTGSDEESPNIPQTGSQWMPVIMLALAGILLMGIGFVRRGRSKE